MEVLRLGCHGPAACPGFISSPMGKAKSVALTHEGLVKAQALLQSLFGRPG